MIINKVIFSIGHKGLAATNCENRVLGDLAGRSFASLWNAAPAADLTGALNSENYLSYYLGTTYVTNFMKFKFPIFRFGERNYSTCESLNFAKPLI
jgi:hypothetical protein